MKIRQETRDIRRTELHRAHAAAAKLAARKATVVAQMEDLADAVRRGVGPGSIDIEPMLQAQRYQAVLEAERQAIERQAAAVAEEIDRRRAAVVAADREVRVLEKLRDRQAARHRDEVHRAETKELDEIAARPRRGTIGERKP
jgi:flagellar FliJ protein